MTSTALKNLYAEASLRMGRLNNEYSSHDLFDAAGNTASYDANNLYYGAHVGLGYVWNVFSKVDVDVYGKYFWVHQNKNDISILGDTFRFEASDSHRTRLGARVNYEVNDYISPYVGAAWEYEFDGKVRALIPFGFDATSPSVQGSSGMGELGLQWRPSSTGAFSIDLGVQGYTGMREGVAGNLMLKYEF